MAEKIAGGSTGALIHLLKSNRAKLVLVGTGVVCLLLVAGVYLKNSRETGKEQPAVPKTVTQKAGQEHARKEQGGQGQQQAAFLLHPTPDELLQQLASMETLNDQAAEAKFTGLRVLWPVYYFDSQNDGSGTATLLLDVSEDGFGVLVESEVELSAYPQISTLQAGQKIWIAGEILAVDPSGAGTIYLKTVQLQLKDEQPLQTGQTH